MQRLAQSHSPERGRARRIVPARAPSASCEPALGRALETQVTETRSLLSLTALLGGSQREAQDATQTEETPFPPPPCQGHWASRQRSLPAQPSPWTHRWVLILLIMAPAPGLPGIRCPVLGPVLLFRHRAWFCVLPCLPHRWATAGSKLCSPVLTSRGLLCPTPAPCRLPSSGPGLSCFLLLLLGLRLCAPAGGGQIDGTWDPDLGLSMQDKGPLKFRFWVEAVSVVMRQRT